MKKTYQNPSMEMISLMTEDILTASGLGQEKGDIKAITFGEIFN